MQQNPVRRDIVIALQARLGWFRALSREDQIELAGRYADMLDIRAADHDMPIKLLSGGNQQKAILARWLAIDPTFLILDEPTRGIDVGAKYEIYTMIRDLAEQGKSIIVISSEMPELLGITDRVLVMNEGRLVGELPTAEATQEKIMSIIIKSGHDLTEANITPEEIEAEAAHV